MTHNNKQGFSLAILLTLVMSVSVGGCAAPSPAASSTQSLSVSKQALPSWLLGLWCREWVRTPGVMIEDPKAVQNSPQLVRYIQSPREFGDMRHPKDRPTFAKAKSFADMSDSDLLILAKSEGFVGYTTAENDNATRTTVQWHRELDFGPPATGLDIGRLDLVSDDRMYESALDNAYTEHWVRLTNGESRFLVVRVECAGRLDRMLIVAGDQFFYGRNRAKDLPSASSLTALITSTHATRSQIIEYLDCELSVGRIRGGSSPWAVEYSTLPWREGKRLEFVDLLQTNGAAGDLKFKVKDGESWTVPCNTLDPRDFEILFATSK
jgi:hypothetical protein